MKFTEEDGSFSEEAPFMNTWFSVTVHGMLRLSRKIMTMTFNGVACNF